MKCKKNSTISRSPWRQALSCRPQACRSSALLAEVHPACQLFRTLQPLGHLPVTRLVSEEEPATVVQRETLSLQIESLAGEFATASPEQISKLADQLSALKQQLFALPSKLVERYEETGEKFAEVLTHSPALVAQQAIEAVIVAPPAVKYQQRLDHERVQIVWRDEMENDTD